MNYRINQAVITPIGEGIFQGVYGVSKEGSTEEAEEVGLVRLNVNDQTAPHLRDSNCLTPKAVGTALWLFNEGQLK